MAGSLRKRVSLLGATLANLSRVDLRRARPLVLILSLGSIMGCTNSGGSVTDGGSPDGGPCGEAGQSCCDANPRCISPTLQCSASKQCEPCILSMTAGGSHNCAEREDGSIMCWGNNLQGELGDGTVINRPLPVIVVNGDGTPFPAPHSGAGGAFLSAGADHSCAGAGGIVCWGSNTMGQVGNQAAMPDQPLPVEALSNAWRPAAGGAHTCGSTVFSNYGVSCWGANDSGQIGDGSNTTEVLQPSPVVGSNGSALSGIFFIAAGAHHSCATNGFATDPADGAIWCWGANDRGQLGNGTVGGNSQRSASRLQDAAGAPWEAVQIASGDDHTCIIRQSGTVACWGANDSGQLGNGATLDSGTPEPVLSSDGSPFAAEQIAAGGKTTCALRSDGSVLCWGANDAGQLGDGTMTMRTAPTVVRVPGGTSGARVVSIGVGRHHTCALAKDGAIWCWGANESGQLGNGTTNASVVPVPVSIQCPPS